MFCHLNPRNLRQDPRFTDPKTSVSNSEESQFTERGPLVRSHSIFDGLKLSLFFFAISPEVSRFTVGFHRRHVRHLRVTKLKRPRKYRTISYLNNPHSHGNLRVLVPMPPPKKRPNNNPLVWPAIYWWVAFGGWAP